MSPNRKRYTFWIDESQVEILETIRERDGILPSEQIRRALEQWFIAKGLVTKKADRKRVSPRKRP